MAAPPPDGSVLSSMLLRSAVAAQGPSSVARAQGAAAHAVVLDEVLAVPHQGERLAGTGASG
jgi:hypothetical protein